jgi:hypothetical protein
MPYRTSAGIQGLEVDPSIELEAKRRTRKRKALGLLCSVVGIAALATGSLHLSERNERATTAALVADVLGCLLPDPNTAGNLELEYRAARLSMTSEYSADCRSETLALEERALRTHDHGLFRVTRDLRSSLYDADEVLFPDLRAFVELVRQRNLLTGSAPGRRPIDPSYRTLSSLPDNARMVANEQDVQVVRGLPAGSPLHFLVGNQWCIHQGNAIRCGPAPSGANAWQLLEQPGAATVLPQGNRVVLNDAFPKLYALREGLSDIVLSDRGSPRSPMDADLGRERSPYAFLFAGMGVTVFRSAVTRKWTLGTRDLSRDNAPPIPLAYDIGEAPAQAPPHTLDGCSMATGVTALVVEQNLYFRTPSGWSAPVHYKPHAYWPDPRFGPHIECTKDSVRAVELRGRAAVYMPGKVPYVPLEPELHDCTPAGCSLLPTYQRGSTNEAGAADAIRVDERVIMATARDGVRIASSDPSRPSQLLFDDHVANGVYSAASPVRALKLAPSGEGAVLFVMLATSKVFAFAIDASGRAKGLPVRPHGAP